jgi:hypothetical protein
LNDNAREWIKALNCHWRWMGSELRSRILEVRYEDLVLETEDTLRKICQFIGEAFEPQMLSWGRIVDEQVPSREQIRHTKLKSRIGPEAVGRWTREMSAREIFICEAYMGSHLTRLGYERRYPSPLWTPVFALTRLILPIVKLQLRAVRFLGKRLGLRLGST